ncbi:MAG: hypothetical protein ACREL5_11390, partial [Gemmatimonadales bacterium]
LNRSPTLDLFHLMSGTGTTYFDATKNMIVGPLPWVTLGGILALSVTVLLVTYRVLRSRDF